jgi:hypothetical protein
MRSVNRSTAFRLALVSLIGVALAQSHNAHAASVVPRDKSCSRMMETYNAWNTGIALGTKLALEEAFGTATVTKNAATCPSLLPFFKKRLSKVEQLIQLRVTLTASCKDVNFNKPPNLAGVEILTPQEWLKEAQKDVADCQKIVDGKLGASR